LLESTNFEVAAKNVVIVAQVNEVQGEDPVTHLEWLSFENWVVAPSYMTGKPNKVQSLGTKRPSCFGIAGSAGHCPEHRLDIRSEQSSVLGTKISQDLILGAWW
jgi:hypothetical protein